MESNGYSSIYIPRSGQKRDGCGIFFKRDRFVYADFVVILTWNANRLMQSKKHKKSEIELGKSQVLYNLNFKTKFTGENLDVYSQFSLMGSFIKSKQLSTRDVYPFCYNIFQGSKQANKIRQKNVLFWSLYES